MQCRSTKTRIIRLLITIACAWILGLIIFLLITAQAKSNIPKDTQLIVVLTGDSNRISLSLDLLNNSNAEALLISGVGNGVRLGDIVGQERITRNPKPKVILGRIAGNTEGNAIEARITMKMLGYHKVCIVTSDYHILRSYLLFKRYNPDAQISVFAAPSQVGSWFSRKGWLMVREYNGTILLLSNWAYDASLDWYTGVINRALRG